MNFEKYAMGGGHENRKYDGAYANVKKPDLGSDVAHGMNIDEIVSMNELLELASKSKQ